MSIRLPHLICLFLLAAVTAQAQSPYLHQVFVASGGDFNDPDDFASVGVFDPDQNAFEVFDTIFTQSVQDLVVMDESFVFVAAEEKLVKYHADTYERLASVDIPGIHNLAIGAFPYQDHLIVGKWFGTLDNEYVQVYDSNLNLLFSTDEVEGDTDEILAIDDYFLVANQGPFGASSGKIQVFNIAELAYEGEIDLGEEGLGISSLIYVDTMESPSIFALANLGWGSTSANLIELDPSTFETISITSLDKGIERLLGVGDFNEVFYKDWDGALGYFDLYDNNFNTISQGPYAALDIDYEHNTIVATDANYTESGDAHIIELDGEFVLDFPVGISPEAVALDMRLPSSVEELPQGARGLVCYPQPADDHLSILTDLQLNSWRLTDLSGRMLMSMEANWGTSESINVSGLAPGMYIFDAMFDGGIISQKICVN